VSVDRLAPAEPTAAEPTAAELAAHLARCYLIPGFGIAIEPEQAAPFGPRTIPAPKQPGPSAA
jgi:hypothetical protein